MQRLNAKIIGIGKKNPGVDRNNGLPELKSHAVHADFAQAPERPPFKKVHNEFPIADPMLTGCAPESKALADLDLQVSFSFPKLRFRRVLIFSQWRRRARNRVSADPHAVSPREHRSI